MAEPAAPASQLPEENISNLNTARIEDFLVSDSSWLSEGEAAKFPSLESSLESHIVELRTPDCSEPDMEDSAVENQRHPLPDEDQNQNANELLLNGFIQLNTHDSSFADEHIPSIEKIAEDLQLAIAAAWPARRDSRYERVHVLLLSWEDDNLGVDKEIKRLGHVFSHLYQFNVERFQIPRKLPGKATASRVSTFLENDGVGSLLIVYYAGHACLSNQTNEPSIWAATDEAGTPTLPSGGVQQLLEEAESDVLLLYDSCHPSHPAVSISGQGVTEVIAACGFETQAPAIGPHSFTNALIRELEEAFTGPPISVAELHGKVIGSLKNWKPSLLRDIDGNIWTDENGQPRYECHKRRTPVHCFLTNETPYRSIMLAPLRSKLSHAAMANMEGGHSSGSTPSSGATSYVPNSSRSSPSTAPTTVSGPLVRGQSLQVLLALRIEDDHFLDGANEDEGKRIRDWCAWLKNVPDGVKDVVSIQGLYKSCSTLVLLSIPLILWDFLPANKAYSFVGFVNSPNLAHHLLPERKSTKLEVEIENHSPPERTAFKPRVEFKDKTAEGSAPRKHKEKVDKEALKYENPLDRMMDDVEELFAQTIFEKVKSSLLPGGSNPNFPPKPPMLKEEPIKFKDCVGRKFTLPFHMVTTWSGLEELIRQAFLHVELIGPHVQEGHYDLLDGKGEIVLPQVWETVVTPGMSITMHMWPMPEPPKAPAFELPRGGPPPPPPGGWKSGPRPGPPPGWHGPPPPAPSRYHSRNGGPGPAPPGPPPPGLRPPGPPPGPLSAGFQPPPPSHVNFEEVVAQNARKTTNTLAWMAGRKENDLKKFEPNQKSSGVDQEEDTSLRGNRERRLSYDSDEVVVIEEHSPLRRKDKKKEGARPESRASGSSVVSASESEEEDPRIKNPGTFRKVYRVGKVRSGKRGVYEVQVKPNPKLMELINECGRRFIEEVERLEKDDKNEEAGKVEEKQGEEGVKLGKAEEQDEEEIGYRLIDD